MDDKTLIAIRKRAEVVVKGMPKGDERLEAFKIVFNRLLSESPGPTAEGPHKPTKGKTSSRQTEKKPTIPGRILSLKDEGFFGKQRTLSDVQQELKNKGWPYTQPNLSGPLQKLARKKELRRIPVKDGKKSVYKYTNP